MSNKSPFVASSWSHTHLQYFSSVTCFALTVGYHQAIQIVYNIKGMRNNYII